jgi:hypothetical protein
MSTCSDTDHSDTVANIISSILDGQAFPPDIGSKARRREWECEALLYVTLCGPSIE